MIPSLKKMYQSFYSLGLVDRDVFLSRQREIRSLEWNAIEELIPMNSSFLDIGCGKGYSMSLAIQNRDCHATGIDPLPDYAGVAPELKGLKRTYTIEKGFCENLPFENESFDVVYSSHMLEHTSDYHKSLSEMQRVLKPDGVMIMGVPTATMAFLRLLSVAMFNTHRNVIELIRWPTRPSTWKKEHPVSQFIIPPSHGNPNKNIFFDLLDYRITQWRMRVSKYFRIQEEIYPALYSYPDFVQLFPMRKSKRFTSSIFFIARKKVK